MPKPIQVASTAGAAPGSRLDIAPTRARELLHELRDRLADGAASAYAQNLKQAKDDMVQLAQRASEPASQELYTSGHALLTNGSVGLLRRFRDLFVTECDQAVARLTENDADSWDSAGELSLVDSNEFERDLAVGRLSAKAAYHCSQQLTALDRCVAGLLSLKRLDSDSNPFAIKRVFTAFVKAAEVNWAGEQLSLILLDTFEHYAGEELPKVYRALNQYLVDEGVLEKLPGAIEEREHELERRGDLDDLDDLDGNIGDIFAQLVSGLTGGSGGDRSGSPGGIGRGLGDRGLGGGFGFGDTGCGGAGLGGDAVRDPRGNSGAGNAANGLPPLSPMAGAADGGRAGAGLAGEPGPMGPMVFGQFMEGLTGLQRGHGQAAARLGIDANIGEFDPSSSAMLRSLASSPLLRWLQPNDAMTIELIAMLFDCIFSDAEVSEGLHAELGRLQVPILKVALTNKGFFSDQSHPARRLMNMIAAAVRGWNEQDESALLETIRTAVKSVVDDFDNDTDVFRAQVEKLEKILQQADRRGQENVGALVRRLEQRDRNGVVTAVVKDQIGALVAQQTLPTVVHEFINDVWRELLTRIYVKHGDEADLWHQALSTLDDLIWSVQPKTQPEERSRLMAMLPVLLRRLPEGMALIGKADAWDAFLKALMSLHMEAIKQRQQTAASYEPKVTVDDNADAARGPATSSRAAPTDETAHEADGTDPFTSAATNGIDPDQALADSLATVTTAPADGADPVASQSAGVEKSAAAGTIELPIIGDAPDPTVAADARQADSEEPDDAFAEAARRIEVGDWVEFCNIGAAALTLRASWVSRLNGLILFADRQGRNPQILTLKRVAKLMRNANARVLSRDPLTDRAVAKLLVSAAPRTATADRLEETTISCE